MLMGAAPAIVWTAHALVAFDQFGQRPADLTDHGDASMDSDPVERLGYANRRVHLED